MSDRAVGPVIGVILIIAMVLTVAVTVAAFGAAMLQDTQSDIENSQTETAFSQLSVDASELRETGDEVEFNLGHRDGQVQTIDDTGELEVRLERETADDVIYNTSLRSLVYERDGKQVAYQGGGVFRKQGSGSSLVSAPEFFYRDNSLVFPVTILEGDLDKSGSLDGTLSLKETKRIYPTANPNRSNPLQEGTIFVTLESEYCQGWEEYFSTQTRGSIVESCSETGDTAEGEIEVEMSVPFEIEQGMMTRAVRTGTYDGHNNDNLSEGGDYEEGDLDAMSPDSLISQKAGECAAANASWGLNDTVDEGGLHCVNEINDDHEFDTDSMSEEAEVYVDGDVHVQDAGLPVSGTSQNVTFFVNGSLDAHSAKNSSVVGNSADPTQTRIFVHSDGYVFEDYKGSNTAGKYYAVIYAPESDGHVQASGNFQFEGALVVDRFSTGSAGLGDNIEFSTSAADMQMTYEGAGPKFYYLHLVEKRLSVHG